MAKLKGSKTKVYVTIGSLKYGFLANENIHSTYGKTLGQTTFSGATGVFFGANSPKPPRASKDFASGSVSSFCSTDKISALKKDNWVVTRKGTRRGVKTAGKTRTVYIEMPGGWNYAWNIYAEEVDLAGTLGFTQATGANVDDLIWGVNDPKPPRAYKREGGSITSTFIAPKQSVLDKAISEGWSVTSIDYDLVPES